MVKWLLWNNLLLPLYSGFKHSFLKKAPEQAPKYTFKYSVMETSRYKWAVKSTCSNSMYSTSISVKTVQSKDKAQSYSGHYQYIGS